MTVPSLINGEDEIKLMVYYGVGTYDEKGNELKYEEISGDGSWNEYDKNGKKIKNTYIIDNSNSVYYAEYDDRGNTIYWRYSNKKAGYGSETWNKYDNKNREIYYKKKFSDSETIDEHFIEYDKHGNQTKKYSDGSIITEFNKFDRKGNNIYTALPKVNLDFFVNDSGVEEVYEYSYWKNGKLKEKRAYRNASSVDPKFLKSNNETSSSTD